MSETDKEAATKKIKYNILRILNQDSNILNDDDMNKIREWVNSERYLIDSEIYKNSTRNEEILDNIVDELKLILPAVGTLPSETIYNPDSEYEGELPASKLFHVDEFIYTDVDEAFPNSSKYCDDCGSNNIKNTTFISHSFSRLKMHYMFKVMLPFDCSDKTILDVGSRTGAVLYGAYFYSDAKCVYGIEMNKDFYGIQKKIVAKFNLEDRIKLINDDVMNQRDIVNSADVIILNNVFEFFIKADRQIEIWKYLKQNVRKDCILVTIPSLEESFMSLDILKELNEWVTKIPHYQPGNMIYDEEDECCFHDMYMYLVK